MKDKKQKQWNYIPGILLLSIITSFFLYVVLEDFFRCDIEGKSEAVANNIANKYIPIHLKGDFVKKSQSFSHKQKEWSFTYSQIGSNCEVDILIDKCGEFDVTGLSNECISKP